MKGKGKNNLRVNFPIGSSFNTSNLAGIILLDARTFEQNFPEPIAHSSYIIIAS
jgi:hypothetical protein